MRGKGPPPRYSGTCTGITPAYAGKSYHVLCNCGNSRDHPRVCGEKESLTVGVLGNAWITPAYAGKRQLLNKHPHQGWDHPRVCGEKRIICSCCPSMRGITPAYAGKRPHLSYSNSASWDHPRVCGEKPDFSGLPPFLQGSPPRMRGKGFGSKRKERTMGITPAYAGKRLKRSRSTVSPVAIVPLFPSVCNKPVVSDGSPAVRDAPLFLPAENAVPASPACNLRSL